MTSAHAGNITSFICQVHKVQFSCYSEDSTFMHTLTLYVYCKSGSHRNNYIKNLNVLKRFNSNLYMQFPQQTVVVNHKHLKYTATTSLQLATGCLHEVVLAATQQFCILDLDRSELCKVEPVHKMLWTMHANSVQPPRPSHSLHIHSTGHINKHAGANK